MVTLSGLLGLALALGGAAAQSTAYTDSTSGISFASYEDSDSGCRFGLALPETPKKDFIAQIVAPVTNDKGWAGLDLGSTMTGRLLIVAWPYENEIISSFRKATGYTNPPVYSSGNVTMYPIEKGTFVNSTHFSYTFLCENCITGDVLSWTDDETGTVLGWAYSSSALTNPSAADATLTYHTAGYGEFSVNFTLAQSADYATWAAMADTSSTSTNTSSSSNTTTSSNSTAPYSNSTTTSTTSTTSNTTYDYIIAGGGPAGIIVAERLAETGAEVLLIERGEASTYASGGRAVMPWNSSVTQYDVPALGYYLTNMNDTSEYCTDTADMAGCILGGSTMINALMFVRPQERDFDDKWPTGWKWADVAPSAEKFYERNPGSISPSADGLRYDQGAYNVLSQFFSSNGWSSVNALEQPNEKHQVFSHPPWNIQDGLRAGPTLSYLPLAQSYSNFHLSLNTKVVRAVRNGTFISGVEVESSTGSRQIINLKTGGKVILASGTLSTPRILFNSGIGPSDQLSTVQSGSTSVTLPAESDWIDLPVGQGLKDHPIVTLHFSTNSSMEYLATTAFTSPSLNETSMFAQGKGVLTQAGQRLNFWTSVQASDNSTRFIQGTCSSSAAGVLQMKVYLTHGLTSTGVLGITSDGATEFTTDPWLNTATDKEALASFIDQLLAYTRTANSSLTYYSETGSSGNVTGASLISNYISGSHFVGTAKMGTDDGRKNGTSVVDLNTKVYGTDNLFVVDASFHPDLPTGNTQAIVMVAAEAAAAKILALDNTTTVSTVGTSGSSSSVKSVSPVASVASVSKVATGGANQTSVAPAYTQYTTTLTELTTVTHDLTTYVTETTKTVVTSSAIPKSNRFQGYGTAPHNKHHSAAASMVAYTTTITELITVTQGATTFVSTSLATLTTSSAVSATQTAAPSSTPVTITTTALSTVTEDTTTYVTHIVTTYVTESAVPTLSGSGAAAFFSGSGTAASGTVAYLKPAGASLAPYGNGTALGRVGPTGTGVAALASASGTAASAVSAYIATITAALPSGALTSTLPTAVPTGAAAPAKELPTGYTLKDLLDWVEYLLASAMSAVAEEEVKLDGEGVQRRHARDILTLGR